jgi:hypothetical protein
MARDEGSGGWLNQTIKERGQAKEEKGGGDKGIREGRKKGRNK